MAQVLPHIILFRSRAFQEGYIAGCNRESPRWCPLTYPLDEETLVTLLRNVCELYGDGELTEEQLRNTIGLMTGWLVGRKQ